MFKTIYPSTIYGMKMTYSWGDNESMHLFANKEDAWKKAVELASAEAVLESKERDCEIGIINLEEEGLIKVHYTYDDSYCNYEVVTIDIKNFFVDGDLAKYVDSMLFDSGTHIANMELEIKGKKVSIDLQVSGSVCVEYKDELYHTPSEFPEEVKELIRNAPNEWDTNEYVFVHMNNWFEFIFDVEDGPNDGLVLESDLSKHTENEIFNHMITIAENEIFL